MSRLSEVGDFLEAFGIGVVGTDLFLGRLPAVHPSGDAQVEVMALIQYPGAPPDHQVDGAGSIATTYTRFQFLVRAATLSAAISKAESAYQLLAPVANTVFGTTSVMNVRVLQSPGILWRDAANDYPVCGFNFEVMSS